MKIINLFGLLSCFLLAACFGKKEQAAETPAQTEQSAEAAAAEPAAEGAEESAAA